MHRKLVSRTCEGYLRCSSFVAAAAAAARGSACSSLTIRVLVPKYTSQTDAYVHAAREEATKSEIVFTSLQLRDVFTYYQEVEMIERTNRRCFGL